MGSGERLWELSLGGTGGMWTPQCGTLFLVRQVWFYVYVWGILRLRNLCGCYKQGAEAVSEAFPVAGISGPSSEFRFRVHVVFYCVGVNSSLLLLNIWCVGVRVGGREPLWALCRGGIGG